MRFSVNVASMSQHISTAKKSFEHLNVSFKTSVCTFHVCTHFFLHMVPEPEYMKSIKHLQKKLMESRPVSAQMILCCRYTYLLLPKTFSSELYMSRVMSTCCHQPAIVISSPASSSCFLTILRKLSTAKH